MTYSPQKALYLPEILLSISQHLTCSSLLSCLRVSRACHAILVPLIWADISLTATVAESSSKQEPTLEAVLNHAHLVRNLTLRYVSTEDHFKAGWTQVFSNLSRLGIEQQDADGSIVLPLLASFILKNKATLVSLRMDRQVASNEVLDAMSECQHLEQCNLSHPLLIDDPILWTSQFERLWSRLEVVSLMEPVSNSQHTSTTIHPKDWPNSGVPAGQHHGSKIRDLTLSHFNNDFVYDTQLWILKRCTDLRRLSWFIKGKETLAPMQQLAEIIQQGESCQQLEELRMGSMNFKNSDFESLVSSMAQLTVLDLMSSNFNGDSWKILKNESRHLGTLTYLEMRSYGLPGWAVQEMMCSIPNLKEFRATEMSDTDILENDIPWVCLGLEKLTLQFDVFEPASSFPASSSFSSGKDMILTRISELTRLEDLTIEFIAHRPTQGRSTLDYLSLSSRKTLGGGLDILRTLRQLRAVSHHLVLCKGKAEAEWITENWPLLEGSLKNDVAKVMSKQ